MKKLIPALCMLLVAAALLGTSTFAWFSMNTQVNATGMKVKATALGSLVIQQDEAPAANYTETSITMEAPDSTAILDATHDDAQISGSFITGLKTVASENRTGIPTTSGAYSGTYETVAVDTPYYIDYVVYIASKDAAIEGQSLTATFSAAAGTNFANAVAIDIYQGTAGKDTYKGTVHAASTGNSVTWGDNRITIPASDGTAGIMITMRVYIDGAVETVYTNNYSAEDITFNVTFTASVTQ